MLGVFQQLSLLGSQPSWPYSPALAIRLVAPVPCREHRAEVTFVPFPGDRLHGCTGLRLALHPGSHIRIGCDCISRKSVFKDLTAEAVLLPWRCLASSPAAAVGPQPLALLSPWLFSAHAQLLPVPGGQAPPKALSVSCRPRVWTWPFLLRLRDHVQLARGATAS